MLRLFSRKWMLTTILVVAAVAVMVRLGFWQLDRLEARRAFNARVQAQLDQPALELHGVALEVNLTEMDYRAVVVEGEYDFSQEVALRNQAREGQWGVDLITPLRIAGSDRAVLVNRGWIPGDDFQSGNWEKYAEPGRVKINGMIRASQSKPDFGRRSDPTPAPGQGRLEAWNFVNVTGIANQVSYPLLPIYIQQAPDPAWTGMPYRSLPHLELTEGSHLGYALQWFTFATILGLGYPFYIRKEELHKNAAGAARAAKKNPLIPIDQSRRGSSS